MEYSGKLVDLYDKIFSKKRYDREVDFVLNANDLYSDCGPLAETSNVLDVGCGTGTHSLILREKTKSNIIGTDFSPEMINKAKEKSKDISRCFFFVNAEKFPYTFDIVISMFYVVNHVHSLRDLEDYFNFISVCCKKGGIFIFDCWNGVAALRDPPHGSTVERYSDGKTKIVTTSTPNTDLLTSTSNILNVVKIYSDNVITDGFGYTLKHIFWTPFILSSILEKYDFDVLDILKPYEINQKASCDDYKIVYVCKKKR